MDSNAGPGPAASRLFDSLDPAERGAVLASATRRSIARGRFLLRQGEPASTLYLVERGYLKLTQVTTEGSDIIIRFAGPGAPVGGVAALGKALYPISAVACEPAAVAGWSGEALTTVLAAYPAIGTNIMREMSTHMGDALMRVGELTTERVARRIARALLRVAEQSGRVASSVVEIPHALTRQEVAQLAGTTVFTVSRVLSEWETAGLVRSTRARVRIMDLPALRRVAERDDSAH